MMILMSFWQADFLLVKRAKLIYFQNFISELQLVCQNLLELWPIIRYLIYFNFERKLIDFIH